MFLLSTNRIAIRFYVFAAIALVMPSVCIAESLKQQTLGWCSPAVANVEGDVNVICTNTEKSETDKRAPLLAIDRVSKLSSDDGSLALDIIISNSGTSNGWINKIGLIGLGASNAACNPNAIATFRYDASFKIDQGEVSGSIKAPNDDLAIGAKGVMTGHFEHEYCDGYFFATYPQTVKIPSNDKISYIIRFKSIELIIKDGYSKHLERDAKIPRLGMSINEEIKFQTMRHFFAKSEHKDMFSGKEFFGGAGPSYHLPMWKSWILVFYTDEGQILVARLEGSGFSYSPRLNGEPYPVLAVDELVEQGVDKELAKAIIMGKDNISPNKAN